MISEGNDSKDWGNDVENSAMPIIFYNLTVYTVVLKKKKSLFDP